MASAEPPSVEPPSVIVPVPPSDPVTFGGRQAALSEQLGLLERRLDSFNVFGGILLAGFGLLLTIIFNLNLPSKGSEVDIAGYFQFRGASLTNVLLAAVVIPLASATCCLIAIYGSLGMRTRISLASLDDNTTVTDDTLSREKRRRLMLVERNRVLLALVCTGFYLELVLTSFLLIVAVQAAR
jgi:hypothetical protein